MLKVKKIEAAISSSNLTKAKLCSKLGIARSTLDAILNGSDAKISTIESIAEELGISMGFLFDEEPTEHYEQHGEKSVMAKQIDRIEMDNRVMSQESVEKTEARVSVLDEKIVLPSDCPDESKSAIALLTSEVEHLKQLLSEKDARIEEKNEIIADLRERIKEMKER